MQQPQRISKCLLLKLERNYRLQYLLEWRNLKLLLHAEPSFHSNFRTVFHFDTSVMEPKFDLLKLRSMCAFCDGGE